MKRVTAVAVAAVLVAGVSGGCARARADAATTALRRAANGLSEIRSGTLRLGVTLTTPAAKGPVGFTVTGPFQLATKDKPAAADFRYVRVAGGEKPAVRVVVADGSAYAVTPDGTVTRLGDDAAKALGGAGKDAGALRIDRWLRDPVATDGGTLDGVETTRVDAGVDVAAMLADLVPLARGFGANKLGALSAEDQKRLAASVRDATMRVWTGADDGLPRRIELRATVGDSAQAPEGLRSLLPVSVSLEFAVTGVNRPVRVVAPTP